MAEKLSFSLTIKDSCKTFEESIAKTIKINESEFLRYFERLIDTEDARYTVTEESMEISEISLNNIEGYAYGAFTWDFYAGCKDINPTGQKEFEIKFKILDQNLYFDIELPIIWRSDGD